MEMKLDKAFATTLTLADAFAADPIDLPIRRLVRLVGDASLYVVEKADCCKGCALHGDCDNPAPFPCESFACCDYNRRDGEHVVLRRVDDAEAPVETETETEAPR